MSENKRVEFVFCLTTKVCHSVGNIMCFTSAVDVFWRNKRWLVVSNSKQRNSVTVVDNISRCTTVIENLDGNIMELVNIYIQFLLKSLFLSCVVQQFKGISSLQRAGDIAKAGRAPFSPPPSIGKTHVEGKEGKRNNISARFLL